ncbi:MAG: hypothetical protein MUF23_02775 [Pirellula sp.]|nr:hypothetical protein [Pirellula sp.]
MRSIDAGSMVAAISWQLSVGSRQHFVAIAANRWKWVERVVVGLKEAASDRRGAIVARRSASLAVSIVARRSASYEASI